MTKILVAGNRLSAAVDEVRAVCALGVVAWDGLELELAAMLHTVRDVRTALESKGAEGAGLQQTVDSLQHQINPNIWQSAVNMNPVALKATTTDDRMTLARSAIAAARKQIAIYEETKPGVHRQQAIALCTPIRLHLIEAAEAAASVGDRVERFRLAPEVEGLSSDMKMLSGLLSMEPRLSWDPAFAGAFDAENHLRRDVMGLGPIERPYSGTIDPTDAMNIVKNTLSDSQAGKSTASGARFDNPRSAGWRHRYKVSVDTNDSSTHWTNQDTISARRPSLKTPLFFDTLLDFRCRNR